MEDVSNDPDVIAVLLVERMLSTASRCPEDIAGWISEEIAAAIKRERDQCAAIATRLHGSDGDYIATAIRNRK